MATFQSWHDKYKFCVSQEIWDTIEYGIVLFQQTTPFLSVGILDKAKTDLDRYLCPQLFIAGIYDSYLGLKAGTLDEPNISNNLRKYLTNFQKNLSTYNIWIEYIEKRLYSGFTEEHRLRQIEANLKYEWRHDNSVFVSNLISLFESKKNAQQIATLDDIFVLDCEQDDEDSIFSDFMSSSSYFANLRKDLSNKVIGQDAAVSLFIQGLFTGQFNRNRTVNGPESTFLFVGPPGVGKTFLATTAAKYLNRPSEIFQMSDYTDSQSTHSINGFESTWKDAEDGKLTKYVSEHPNAVLIFDEIEKAHPNVIRLFLPILEGGTLQSLYTKENVDFTKTIVIFTTNAGRDFYEEKRNMKISALPETIIIDALKQDKDSNGTPKMPTEILSRLSKGYIIGFDHMNPAKLVPIIKQGLTNGADLLSQQFGLSCSYNESQFPYLFLYHLGSRLDARVAQERSKKFLIDTLYTVAERAGETPGKYQNENGEMISHIHFDVADSEPLAKELLIPSKKSNIIMVSYRADRQKVDEQTDWYRRYDAWDTSAENEEGKQSKIIEIMNEHKISAILVDPYFAITSPDNETEDHFEGILHLNSRGTNVLRWLLKQNNMPPIYIMEMNEHISLVDRIELQNQGVKGFLDFVGQTDEDCTRQVNNLIYELFLSKKIEHITSKGRALEFNIGQQIENDRIDLTLLNFKLVNNMTTDATEVTISDAEKPDTTFDDVIGADNAKAELRRFIQFLKDPDEYFQTGMAISKGILLYGPPGTGKTKLARALACEADCPFISTTGAQFVNGEKNISHIFRLARKYAPSVVFIDEIDAFAKDRTTTDEYRATLLNSLLTEMDGFASTSDRPVFVIAATNFADAPGLHGNRIYLSPALLRRFSKKVYVDLPSKDERIQFLEMKKTALASKDYNLNDFTAGELETFAKHTAGFSIAELENALNLAIGNAYASDEPLTLEILRDTFDESVYGEKMKIAPYHIKTTALHEAGHAYMCYLYKDQFKPQFATLVARGDYLGMVREEENENGFNFSREDLLHRIQIKLAGRAAEIVFNGAQQGLTDGASNDLSSATYIARNILSRFGMEEGFLPAINEELMLQSPLAEKYYAKLNEILQAQLDQTIQILTENKDTIEQLADELIEKAHLDFEDIERIILGK